MTESSPELPFAVKFIVLFLGVDILERLGWIVTVLLDDGSTLPRTVLAFSALWVATDGLLILLLTLRTYAGRIWTILLFSIHIIYVVFQLIHERPFLWVSLDGLGQARLFVTVGIDALILHLVSTQAARDVLVE